MTVCIARGDGWVCEREAKTKGFCSGHYQQVFRKKPLAPLKGEHGAPAEESVHKAVRYPKSDAEAIAALAKARDLDEAVLYREAVAQYLRREKPGQDGG